MAHRRGRGDDHHVGQAAPVGAIKLAPGTTRSTRCPVQRDGSSCSVGSASRASGAIPYQKALEIGRTPMAIGKTKAPVENVTISIDDTPKAQCCGSNGARRPLLRRLRLTDMGKGQGAISLTPHPSGPRSASAPLRQAVQQSSMGITLRCPSVSRRKTIRSQPCMLVGVYSLPSSHSLSPRARASRFVRGASARRGRPE